MRSILTCRDSRAIPTQLSLATRMEEWTSLGQQKSIYSAATPSYFCVAMSPHICGHHEELLLTLRFWLKLTHPGTRT